MGPSTVAQRVDLIEEKLQEMEESMKDLVMKSVEKAMDAMRHTLTEVLIEGQTLASKKMGDDFETLTARMEGRVHRSREHHESLLNTMRNDQLKFQAEVKSALTGFPGVPPQSFDKADGSVNRGTTPLGGPDLGTRGHGEGSYGGGGRDGVGSGYGNGSGQGPGPQNWRYRNLDMPIFDGSDPDGWILRVERYFGFSRLNEEEMLEAVVVAMEGDAL